MYKVTLEAEEMVIRIKRELMDQAAIARLLDLVNLAAVPQSSRLADEKEKILVRMLGFPPAYCGMAWISGGMKPESG